MLKFEYELVRKNVKNINCRIKNDGRVFVSASKNVSIDYIESFLESKQDLILDKIKEFNKRPKNEIIDGNQLNILGNKYTISIKEHTIEKVYLKNDIIVIQVKDINNYNSINKKFDLYCKKLCKEIVEPIAIETYELLKKYNISYPTIKYKKMKSMWGNCYASREVVTFSTNLVFTNYDFVKYIILHEFTHLIHQNHQKEFYSVIEEFMPNYKKIKGNLYE